MKLLVLWLCVLVSTMMPATKVFASSTREICGSLQDVDCDVDLCAGDISHFYVQTSLLGSLPINYHGTRMNIYAAKSVGADRLIGKILCTDQSNLNSDRIGGTEFSSFHIQNP